MRAGKELSEAVSTQRFNMRQNFLQLTVDAVVFRLEVNMPVALHTIGNRTSHAVVVTHIFIRQRQLSWYPGYLIYFHFIGMVIIGSIRTSVGIAVRVVPLNVHLTDQLRLGALIQFLKGVLSQLSDNTPIVQPTTNTYRAFTISNLQAIQCSLTDFHIVVPPILTAATACPRPVVASSS